ncbi:hypothetical protein PINS_up013099, partial [Pythium insidiosum]
MERPTSPPPPPPSTCCVEALALTYGGAVDAETSWRSTEEYEVVFNESRLGLTLKCQATANSFEGAPELSTVVRSTAPCSSQVKEGDILVSVNGENVVGLDFREVRRLLKVSSRPIRLRFRPGVEKGSWLDDTADDTSDIAISDVANA